MRPCGLPISPHRSSGKGLLRALGTHISSRTMSRVMSWIVSGLWSKPRAVRVFRMACLSRRSTMGLSLWVRGWGGQEGQLRSWSPHFWLVSGRWPLHPIQCQGKAAGAQTEGPPGEARALSKQRGGQMCSVPTGSPESKASLQLLQIPPAGWGPRERFVSVHPFLT